jgi:hypothetical protein
MVSNGKGKGHINGRAGKRAALPVPKVKAAKLKRPKKK